MPTNNTLLPIKDKSVNFDESDNIIIEGDNLEALKILQNSYYKKVDVIYIDPPYNTGNDFVYDDDYAMSSEEYRKSSGQIDEEGNKTTTNQKANARYHTNWLNMMYPRLKLASELLKDDGVIFISIDDNEQCRLKMICDEIFGDENFICNLIWRSKNTGGGSDKLNIDKETEFIIMYAKKRNKVKFNSQKINYDEYIYSDSYFETRGKYKLTDLDRVSSKSSFQYIESLDYEIIAPDGTKFKNYRNIIKPKSYCYTLGKEMFDFYDKNDFIEYKKNKEGYWRAYRKMYSKVTIDRINKEIVERIDGRMFNNLIIDGKITTSSGKKELIKLIDDKDFSFPKPVKLIKYLINLNRNNLLILDFFAGSGTTGQAVMDLNKEDGGNRKFILVQIPEKIENNKQFNYISDITRERIKRSIKMFDYKEKGFKFFKVDSTNRNLLETINKNDSNEQMTLKFTNVEKTFKDDRTIEDIKYELLLLNGLDLNTKLIKQKVDDNEFYIDDSSSFIFAIINKPYKNIDETIIKVFKQKKCEGSLDVYLNDNNFINSQDKTNTIKQIESFSDNIKVWVL